MAGPTAAGTSPVVGYDVFVGTSPGGEYSLPANGATPVDATSFAVTRLSNGTKYYFTVRAVTASGLSAPSNEVSVTPTADYKPVGTLTGPVVGMASNPAGHRVLVGQRRGAGHRATAP